MIDSLHNRIRVHKMYQVGAAPTWYILCTLVLLKKNSIFQKHFWKKIEKKNVHLFFLNKILKVRVKKVNKFFFNFFSRNVF